MNSIIWKIEIKKNDRDTVRAFYFYKWKREEKRFQICLTMGSQLCATEDCMIYFNIGFDLLQGDVFENKEKEGV